MDIDKVIVEYPLIQNMINCDEIFWRLFRIQKKPAVS